MPNIYVATSWRNVFQLHLITLLRSDGHDVYDFRNPTPTVPGVLKECGFHWSEIDPNWKQWTKTQYRKALKHPIAEAGFKTDMEALTACDICVLVLPSGRSAHAEAGWAKGQGKKVIVYIPTESTEPELMYSMFDGICITPMELLAACWKR